MRKLITVFLVALILSIQTGCASTSGAGDILKQFSGTLEGVCKIWGAVKPHYPEIRTIAIRLHDAGQIDADIWRSFIEIDKQAGNLDRALSLVCERESGASNEAALAKERRSVNWDAVWSSVLKVAAFAIENGLLK